MKTDTKADVEHIRAELVLTIHDVAKALAKCVSTKVLSAGDSSDS
jgi:hypothetical protein